MVGDGLGTTGLSGVQEADAVLTIVVGRYFVTPGAEIVRVVVTFLGATGLSGVQDAEIVLTTVVGWYLVTTDVMDSTSSDVAVR